MNGIQRSRRAAESWETETSIERGLLCILLLLASKRPLRKKMIQMTDQSH
jgi:hypothetical protein